MPRNLFHKKLTNQGSITIPSLLRDSLKWRPGCGVTLEVVDGGILLRLEGATCSICGSVDNVVMSDDLCLCKSCASKVSAKFNIIQRALTKNIHKEED